MRTEKIKETNRIIMTDYVEIAQIVTPFIVLLGIIISMWLSIRALREVQRDRRLRQMPHLAFEYEGGGIYYIEFVKIGRAVPGIGAPMRTHCFQPMLRG